MSPAHLPRVLLQHAHLPLAVLVVLAQQVREVLAVLVRGAHRRVEHDATTGFAQAIVELVVLVAHQLLVEQPDAGEHRARPHAEVDGIDLALLGAEVEIRADAEARRRGDRDRVAEPAAADRVHTAADVVGAGALQRLDPDAEIVGRDPRVAVDARDHLAARGADGHVERRRHDALRVVQQAHARIARRIRSRPTAAESSSESPSTTSTSKRSAG